MLPGQLGFGAWCLNLFFIIGVYRLGLSAWWQFYAALTVATVLCAISSIMNYRRIQYEEAISFLVRFGNLRLRPLSIQPILSRMPANYRWRLRVEVYQMLFPAGTTEQKQHIEFPGQNKAFGGGDGTSYIFVADEVSPTNTLSRFRLFHEIGHACVMGTTIYSRPMHFLRISLIFSMHLFWLGSVGGTWIWVVGQVLLLLLVWMDTQSAPVFSETFADSFALASLDTPEEIQEVSKSRWNKYEQEAERSTIDLHRAMRDDTALGPFFTKERETKLLKTRARVFKEAYEMPDRYLRKVRHLGGFGAIHLVALLVIGFWAVSAVPPTLPWLAVVAAIVPLLIGPPVRDVWRASQAQDKIEELIRSMLENDSPPASDPESGG